MRVCIIGAGWYGCHAARFLRSHGCYVHILDKEGIFTGASSKNQNRLHLGYHYPRSLETIRECEVGHTKFLKHYGECVIPFDRNYYLFHTESKVSPDFYRKIFNNQSHREIYIDMRTNNLANTVFCVDEKFIDNRLAKQRMETELESLVEICQSPQICGNCVNGVEYDYILNCTNNQYVPIPIPFNPIYETVCSLIYKIEFEKPTGLTIMDGPFFSIFPYDMERGLYTVTHVLHSVIDKGTSMKDSTFIVDDIKRAIEDEMFVVFPDLKEKCEYSGYFTSKKTKYDYENDDRSLRWFQSGNYFSFSGGKITGIFEMEPVLIDKIINTPKISV